MKYEELNELIVEWATNKDLIKKDNAKTQMLKVLEEVGELSGALLKDNQEQIIDGIGDSLVTLIILSSQLGLDSVACLESAWNEIKDRTGKTVNGSFIKETK